MTIWFLCDEIAELKRCQFFITNHVSTTTVELRYISRFFFIYFTVTSWSKENRSLYRGLRFIVVRYIEVPQYNIKFKKVAQGAQAILIGTTKRIYVYPFFFFFLAYILNFKYSQTPLIRILRGSRGRHRKCPH